jgi:hypothetical protein
MNDKFDQLAKGVAESVTRRQALKRFGLGVAAMVVACFGLTSKAESKNCIQGGFECGRPRLGGCGDCCSKSFFCEISADLGRQCFCN